MKPFAVLAVLIFSLAVPSFLAGQSTSSDYTNNHVEIGTFADYFRLSRTTPNINFVGVGGRAGFNVHPNIQLEAEMSYDFERAFVSPFTNVVGP